MKIFIKRIAEILSVVLLFLFSNTMLPLLINLIVIGLFFYLEFREKALSLDILAFFLTYFTMTVVGLLFPRMDLLPHTPHFIYPILTVLTLISIVVKQPFTGGSSFASLPKMAQRFEYFRTSLWLFCFLGASVSSFYFFPNYLYLASSFGFLALAIVLNMMLIPKRPVLEQ